MVFTRDFTIYTAGGMQKYGKEDFEKSNDWRRYCKLVLENCECNYNVRVINPNDYFNFADESPQYKTQSEVMNFDLYKLRNSDLVVINFNDMYSLGSMAELAIAHERGIPVIGHDKDKQTLHPWQQCMCERIFDNIDKMIYYIEDFYLR